jgi:hypothetical protein
MFLGYDVTSDEIKKARTVVQNYPSKITWFQFWVVSTIQIGVTSSHYETMYSCADIQI